MTQQSMFFDEAAQKEAFFSALKRGEHLPCPCCDRYSQIYRRRIHSGMALNLIKLYRAGGQDNFIHFAEFIGARGEGSDFTICRYWGLVEPGHKIEGEENKKDSGRWKLTVPGVFYVKGHQSVPKYAYVFDNQVLQFSEEFVTVRDALGAKFNYDEIMSNYEL